MFDYLAFRNAPLRSEPFDYVVVPEFVDPADTALIRADFPNIADAGLAPLSTLISGPRFTSFIEELHSPGLTEAFSEKFGIDLEPFPLMITVRGRCGPRDGRIHTDSKTKVLSALIYFNEYWNAPGGRLRMLRGNNIEDYAEEVAPEEGTLVAFRRSDQSFHGHLPYVGVRRCVQFNWMANEAVTKRELSRHHWSAQTKKFNRAIRTLVQLG